MKSSCTICQFLLLRMLVHISQTNTHIPCFVLEDWVGLIVSHIFQIRTQSLKVDNSDFLPSSISFFLDFVSVFLLLKIVLYTFYCCRLCCFFLAAVAPAPSPIVVACIIFSMGTRRYNSYRRCSFLFHVTCYEVCLLTLKFVYWLQNAKTAYILLKCFFFGKPAWMFWVRMRRKCNCLSAFH